MEEAQMAADRVARIHAIVNTTAVSALMLKAARAMDGNARDQIHIPLRPRNVRISGMIVMLPIRALVAMEDVRAGTRDGIEWSPLIAKCSPNSLG
jgi:hypothetical protein